MQQGGQLAQRRIGPRRGAAIDGQAIGRRGNRERTAGGGAGGGVDEARQGADDGGMPVGIERHRAGGGLARARKVDQPLRDVRREWGWGRTIRHRASAYERRPAYST